MNNYHFILLRSIALQPVTDSIVINIQDSGLIWSMYINSFTVSSNCFGHFKKRSDKNLIIALCSILERLQDNMDTVMGQSLAANYCQELTNVKTSHLHKNSFIGYQFI